MIRRGQLCIILVLGLCGPAAAEGVTRVISLAPHATELVIAAGGRSRLVAAVPADSPLPPATLELGVVGGVDREGILQLAPDLVVVWGSGNRASDIAWMHAQGIPIYVSEPRKVAQIAEDIRAIGKRLDTADRAQAAAAHFQETLRAGCHELSTREAYIAVWDRPAMSIGGDHWLNDALAQAGLVNTFRDVPRPVFSVERESLLSREDLPRVSLRDGTPLGSRLLGRPGPLLAKALRRLCEQRLTGSLQPPLR